MRTRPKSVGGKAIPTVGIADHADGDGRAVSLRGDDDPLHGAFRRRPHLSGELCLSGGRQRCSKSDRQARRDPEHDVPRQHCQRCPLVPRTVVGRVEVAIQLVQFPASKARALAHVYANDLMLLGVRVVGGPLR